LLNDFLRGIFNQFRHQKTVMSIENFLLTQFRPNLILYCKRYAALPTSLQVVVDLTLAPCRGSGPPGHTDALWSYFKGKIFLSFV